MEGIVMNINNKGIDTTMIQTVNEYQFTRAFAIAERDNFSYDGLKALFESLEQFEDETGETEVLDVIALCCEYAEYDSLAEYNRDYNKLHTEIEDVREDTGLIEIDSKRFIIRQY